MERKANETMLVPSEHVARIIGPGGKTIQRINQLSGCQIQIARDNVENSREVTLSATTASTIQAARTLISAVVNGEDISTWEAASLQHEVNNQPPSTTDTVTSSGGSCAGGGSVGGATTSGEERIATMEAAISSVFSNMSFGKDVDPDVMSSVMDKMKSDMLKEVGGALGQQRPASAALPEARPPPTSPSSSSTFFVTTPISVPMALSAHVHLLRFDGGAQTRKFGAQEERCASKDGFSVPFEAEDTVDAFVARALALQGVAAADHGSVSGVSGSGGGGGGDSGGGGAGNSPMAAAAGAGGGDFRVDCAPPWSLSPATVVQPTWQSMGAVLGERNLLDAAAATAAAASASAAAEAAEATAMAPRGAAVAEETPAQPLTKGPPPLPPPVVMTIHWYPGPPRNLEGAVGAGDWVRVVTVTKRSLFVGLRNGGLTLGELQRSIEAQAGVPVEWQRILLGNGRVVGGGGSEEGSSRGSEGGGQSAANQSTPSLQHAVAALGVRPRSNLYLTARVEGVEYGGTNADRL